MGTDNRWFLWSAAEDRELTPDEAEAAFRAALPELEGPSRALVEESMLPREFRGWPGEGVDAATALGTASWRVAGYAKRARRDLGAALAPAGIEMRWNQTEWDGSRHVHTGRHMRYDPTTGESSPVG